jgi:uncharacterized membrane protein YdjX (TVP38/TMEM64 family)
VKTSSIVRLVVAVLLAAAIVLVLVRFEGVAAVDRFIEWVRGTGALGPVVVGLSYVVTCLLFIPGSLVTLGAGLLFGVPLGTVTVSLGSTAGAAAAFLAGRTLLRGFMEAKVARYPKFRAIDLAVERHGFRIVLLTRLSPVFPFNFLNYAFGVTRVSFMDYLLASWIGMLPGTVMYVYVGSTLQKLKDVVNRNQTLGETVLFVAGLVVTVALTVYVTRVAKRAMDETLSSSEPPERNPHG